MIKRLLIVITADQVEVIYLNVRITMFATQGKGVNTFTPPKPTLSSNSLPFFQPLSAVFADARVPK